MQVRGRTKVIKGRRTALAEIAAQEGEEDGSSMAGVEDSMDTDAKVSSHTSFDVAVDAAKPAAPGSESDFEPDAELEDSQPLGTSDGGGDGGGEEVGVDA